MEGGQHGRRFDAWETEGWVSRITAPRSKETELQDDITKLENHNNGVKGINIFRPSMAFLVATVHQTHRPRHRLGDLLITTRNLWPMRVSYKCMRESYSRLNSKPALGESHHPAKLLQRFASRHRIGSLLRLLALCLLLAHHILFAFVFEEQKYITYSFQHVYCPIQTVRAFEDNTLL